MKRYILYGLFFVSIYSYAQEKVSKKVIEAKDLKELSAKSKIQLLDVRTEREYKLGFIKGATRININDRNFVDQVARTFDKEKPIYIYCAVGGRSNKASMMLLKNGFKKVYDLKGGYKQWVKQQKR